MKTFTRKLIGSLSLMMAVMTAIPALADDSGTQGTELRSTQKSSDHSKAKTTSKKQAADTKVATDFSTDVDVNSLFIQEFISHYEYRRNVLGNESEKYFRPQGDGEPDASYLDSLNILNRFRAKEGKSAKIPPYNANIGEGALAYFYTCKPFLGARNNFPLSNANFMDNPNGRHAIQFGKTSNDWKQTHQPNMPGMRGDVNDPVVSDYAKCRIKAHFWVTAAALHLAQESRVFQSEEDAKVEIDRIFDVMDESADLFSRILEKTDRVWASAICSSALPFNDESLILNCGTFAADASSNPPKFVVNGRETLSSNGIDGKKFKIAMSQSAGNSQSDSLDFSESDKTSKNTSAGRSATVLSK